MLMAALTPMLPPLVAAITAAVDDARVDVDGEEV